MKTITSRIITFAFILVLVPFLSVPLLGETDAALTLIQPFGARAAALAEATGSAADDISAFPYNPASVSSLKMGHAAASFQQGISDDSFSHIMFGAPTQHGGYGLSIGHYDGGDIQLVDRTIKAQKDLLMSVGFAREFQHVSLGITGKYLSSTLGETYSAHVFAADLGLTSQINSNLRLSASLQNYGSRLRYVDSGDDLPRTVRAGFSYLIAAKAPTTLMLDIPYSLIHHEYRPAVGLEIKLGDLAIRSGYKSSGSGQGEIALGTGFTMGKVGLDYAFALLQGGNALHRVSMDFRFYTQRAAYKDFSRLPKPKDQALPNSSEQANSAEETDNPTTTLGQTNVEIAPGISEVKTENLIIPSLSELSANDDKRVPQTAEEIRLRWWRERFKLGDLDKSRLDWEKLYQDSLQLIEEKAGSKPNEK